MDYSRTVASLTPHMVRKLKTAIELGRWDNGDKLTQEQIESSMQAVMLWEAQNSDNQDNQPFVVGADGELYTGKGESHKLATSTRVDDKNIIAKNKV